MPSSSRDKNEGTHRGGDGRRARLGPRIRTNNNGRECDSIVRKIDGMKGKIYIVWTYIVW